MSTPEFTPKGKKKNEGDDSDDEEYLKPSPLASYISYPVNLIKESARKFVEKISSRKDKYA